MPLAWFIGFPCSLLFGPARWPSLYWRLHRWASSWGPYILTINWINHWLIACLVCADFVTVISVFLHYISVEENAWNCMEAWNAKDVPFLTTTSPLRYVHNKTNQPILNLKPCVRSLTSQSSITTHFFPVQSFTYFRAQLKLHLQNTLVYFVRTCSSNIVWCPQAAYINNPQISPWYIVYNSNMNTWTT